MRAALLTPAHGQILGAMARQLKLLWLLLLPLAAALGLGLYLDRPELLPKLMAGAASVCLQFAWWAMVAALLRQNHPQAAWLVPGQLRRLRECALGLFLLLALLQGGLLALTFDSRWLTLLGVAALMLGMAVLQRWPWGWALVWVIPVSLPGGLRSPTGGWLRERLLAWQAQPPVLEWLLLLGLMLLLLAAVFGRGGSGHARQWQRAAQSRRRQSLENWGGAAATSVQGPAPLRWLAALFSWGRWTWLGRLLGRGPVRRPGQALALAELAVLRGLHWSSVLGGVAVVLALFVLVLWVLQLGWGVNAWQVATQSGPGFSLGLLCMCINPGMGLWAALYQSRREQALLLLLPGMPRGQALTRQVARRQAAHYLLCWGVGLGLASLLSLRSPHGLTGWVLNYAALTLPLALLPWQDWSRRGRPSSAVMAMLVLGLLGGMALLAAVVFGLGLPLWAPLAISVGLTLALAAWRWRALAQLPPPWPVGRWVA